MIVPHFPEDMKVDSPPLSEAWLEIRWRLQPSPIPGQLQDPDFPFALGVFYSAVKERYPHKQDLDASRAPVTLLPFVVRHQFWTGEGRWPVLQVGPGVATVNLTEPYSWELFRREALFLRSKLVDSFGGAMQPTEVIALRYLNAEPFDFSQADTLSFLKANLNTKVEFPSRIPNGFTTRPFPSTLNIQASYELIEPKGTANIILTTGARDMPSRAGPPSNPVNVLMWQLEVASVGGYAPPLSEEAPFAAWLDSAHLAVHEWFFSFVEGDLLRKYKGGR